MDVKIELIQHNIRKIVINKFENTRKTAESGEDFLKELLNTKKWNVSEIESEVESIMQKCSKIEYVVNSIITDIAKTFGKTFVSEVNLSLFVHKIYINMSAYIYFNNEIMTLDAGEKIKNLDDGLLKSIKKSVFDVFPLIKVAETPDPEPEIKDDASESDSGSDTSDNKSISSDKNTIKLNTDINGYDSDSEPDSGNYQQQPVTQPIQPAPQVFQQQPPIQQAPQVFQQPQQPVQQAPVPQKQNDGFLILSDSD